MGWLTDWLNRRSHTINAAAGAGTNYPIRITAHYGIGTDSDDDIYIGNQGEYFRITVDSTSHTNYGLGYPVTYILDIPSGFSNLKAYHKHASGDAWGLLTEKISDDFFNGIECVRFDYVAHKAYISVGFDGATDDIFIRVTKESGAALVTIFNSVAAYYDNRSAVVVVTADDWTGQEAQLVAHQLVNSICVLNGIVISHGIITYYDNTEPDWSAIQTVLDNGFTEVACHSKYHIDNPAESDADIITSEAEIEANLDLPSIYKSGANEYVVGWVEPWGGTSATQRTKLGATKYLCDRSIVSGPLQTTWAAWDATNGLYNRIGVRLWMGSDGEEGLAALNAAFDAVYAAGNIYHLGMHPVLVNWAEGEYGREHLAYIGNRKDVWYVGWGALYAYHYVQERNVLKVTSERCRTDFGDIRFTRNNGTTLLDYFMDPTTYIEADSVEFYVEVSDDLTTDPVNIYVYYNNPAATSISNGVNTFIFFEDFNDLNIADLNGQNNWVAHTAFDVQSTTVKEGSKAVTAATISDYATHAVTVETFKVFVLAHLRSPLVSSLYPCQIYINENSNQITGCGLFSSKFQNLKSGGWEALGAVVNNIWYKIKMALDSASTHKLWLDDVAQTITTSNFTNVSSAVNKITLQVWISSGAVSGFWDLIIVGKYVSPEPAHDAWGEDETVSILKPASSSIISIMKVLLFG